MKTKINIDWCKTEPMNSENADLEDSRVEE